MAVVMTKDGRKAAVKSSPFVGGYSSSRWSGGGTIPLVGQSLFASYAGLYRTQPWLAAAVNKLKNMIARLPLKTYQVDADGNRARLRDHPVPQVLDRPNPQMSGFRLKEWMIGDLALFGNSLTRIMRRPNGEPYELWPVPWPNVEVHGRATPEVYVFHTSKGPIPFPASDALHLRFWSPIASLDPLVGSSPAEPLRRTLMNEDAAARWVTALFQNAARPSGILSTDKTLNREQVDIVRDELQQLYGGVDNAFRVAVMQGGLTWSQTAFSVADSGLYDLRKLQREEVAAAYDIPPPMLQILDKATFSNVTEQHRNLYQDTVAPWLSVTEEEINTQVIGVVPTYADVFVEFDLNEVLKGAPTERAAFYSVARRWLGINEIRAKENEPPLGDPKDPANPYNQVYIPVNEYPIAQGPPSVDAAPPAGKMLAALERAEKAARSQLGGGQQAYFDPYRFAKELCADLGRDDDACLAWATGLAMAVGSVINGAKSTAELASRFATLRSSLLNPEPDDGPLKALEERFEEQIEALKDDVRSREQLVLAAVHSNGKATPPAVNEVRMPEITLRPQDIRLDAPQVTLEPHITVTQPPRKIRKRVERDPVTREITAVVEEEE